MTVPNLVTLNSLSPDEKTIVADLTNRLSRYSGKNLESLAFYDGKFRPSNYGITVPPSMRTDVSLGWCQKVVDSVEARLDWEGWASPTDSNPFGLMDVYNDNSLEIASHQAHLDSLIYGVSFIVVGAGFDDEPNPLITVESPRNMTANYSVRTRRLTSALYRGGDDDEEIVTLYLPNETVYLSAQQGKMTVVDRDQHNLGRVPVAVLANRARSDRPFGRSELTESVRSSTVEGVKTMLNMGVNSEFYAAPQRYILNASEQAYKNPDGTSKSQWQLVQGRMLALSGDTDEDGNPTDNVKVGQFPQSSPQPYISILQELKKNVAADANMPIAYIDANTNAPDSADAIRAAEAPLVKHAERKQAEFSKTWNEVGRLALLVRDGQVPADYSTVKSQWRSASTPTRAAATDSVVKLVQAGVIPADSDVVLDQLDLSNLEKDRVKVSRTDSTPASDGTNPDIDAANIVKARADAMGVLIRAGVVDEAAAKQVGLTGLSFTGLQPVSLRDPNLDKQKLAVASDDDVQPEEK